MKILFFNYEYPPLGGGAANATAYLLKEYSRKPELNVDLVTSSIDSQYHLEKIGDNISIHRLPIGKNKDNLHYQSQKDLLVYSWKAYFFARKLVKKNKYDLSHSFFTVPCGFVSMLLKNKFQIPYIVSLRGSDVPGYSDRFSLIYGFLKPIVKRIWSKSSVVVSNSEGLKELALETNKKQKIGVIYNGIDIQNFKPNPEIRPDDKFIITAGASRITKRKGLDYLIFALSKLIPKYPQIFFRVLGDGNEKENLEKLSKNLGIENNIEFVGRVPRENTSPYYQEASLFVLPSLNEGMSNAMLEALASGLPIVATDTGGTKELVKNGENGFIINMSDADDIAEKIEKLMSDDKLRIKMGENSRKAAENLSWGKVATEYKGLYDKIVKSL